MVHQEGVAITGMAAMDMEGMGRSPSSSPGGGAVGVLPLCTVLHVQIRVNVQRPYMEAHRCGNRGAGCSYWHNKSQYCLGWQRADKELLMFAGYTGMPPEDEAVEEDMPPIEPFQPVPNRSTSSLHHSVVGSDTHHQESEARFLLFDVFGITGLVPRCL